MGKIVAYISFSLSIHFVFEKNAKIIPTFESKKYIACIHIFGIILFKFRYKQKSNFVIALQISKKL